MCFNIRHPTGKAAGKRARAGDASVSRIAMAGGVDRGRKLSCALDWIMEQDAAGPIVAACASVEWLQLLISPEVCVVLSEGLLIALEHLSYHSKISGRVA